MQDAAAPAHRRQFFQACGFDQVKLETGGDLLNLGQLDQKLWAAPVLISLLLIIYRPSMIM